MDRFESNFNTYSHFIDFYQKKKNVFYDEIDISFENIQWLSANLCSLIGAIFRKIENNGNKINIVNIHKSIETILKKNNFLSYFGYPRINDYYDTTIPYLIFNPNDERAFIEYVKNDFIGKKAFPSMSKKLHKKFLESIFEIFTNAVIHSETKEGIFTCGQYFPRLNYIEFTITDLGIGIKNRIIKDKKIDLKADEAIDWAMQDRNTTKTKSGGMGLSLIKEFICLNKGKIHVISNDGFWKLSSDKITKKLFNAEFPGTMVNLYIDTSDTHHYSINE
jgi:hypothetical protein